MEISLYVHGVKGRMGRTISALIETDSSLSLQNNLEAADVAIDFSSHAALESLVQKCVQLNKPIVVGTTGHSMENMKILQEVAKQIPILFSPNFSLGMTVCVEAAKQIAQQLEGLCQIEIIEAHHQTKKDKPSGAALKLAQTVRAVSEKEIPIHSIRAGDIIGDHTVVFVLAGERIELKHQAQTREVFARGAVVAAKFLKTQPPGLYSVKDLFNATCQS
jgi:4-hydroxy-tetrahydrodipicolinate reductase